MYTMMDAQLDESIIQNEQELEETITRDILGLLQISMPECFHWGPQDVYTKLHPGAQTMKSLGSSRLEAIFGNSNYKRCCCGPQDVCTKLHPGARRSDLVGSS